MAETYLTIADITNAHIKKFKDATLAPYVLKANEHLEILSNRLGVLPADISDPIDNEVMEYLNDYLVAKFSKDSIGVNSTDISGDDMYQKLYTIANKSVADLKGGITAKVLTGDADNSKSARSFSYGVRIRTS